MADETIHDDIRSINESLRLITAGQADNAATLRGMNERLFQPGGVVPTMWGEIKAIKKTADDASTAVSKQRAYVAGFSACGLLLGGFVKSALAKMGVNF